MSIYQTLYSDNREYIFFSSTHSTVTKANSTLHYEKHIPWPSEIYSRNASLVQY